MSSNVLQRLRWSNGLHDACNRQRSVRDTYEKELVWRAHSKEKVNDSNWLSSKQRSA